MTKQKNIYIYEKRGERGIGFRGFVPHEFEFAVWRDE